MIQSLDEAVKYASNTKKEEVGKPVKCSISLGEGKGTIVSIFYGKNRSERRMHSKNRVREKSPETFHPASKDARKKQFEIIRARNLVKNSRKY